jgi:hypothetical protein
VVRFERSVEGGGVMGEWLIFEEPDRIGGAGWSCLSQSKLVTCRLGEGAERGDGLLGKKEDSVHGR